MYNVASGPSVYPPSVLEKIASGVINYEGSGYSILEIGHRSELFYAIRDELNALTKELLSVPDDYTVLYLQGGGRLHLAQIPMNFLDAKKSVQFINSGYWSNTAIEYARAYGEVKILASSKESNYNYIPKIDVSNLEGDYLQYCANNTIYGTQFNELPTANIPVVADMSSDIFSRALDWSKLDVVMACAQKNIGPAGISLLIIKNQFLEKASKSIPNIFNYKLLAEKKGNYNTPPVFQICACLEMLRWMTAKGGVAVLEQDTKKRAQFLYDAIDKSDLVENDIAVNDRSIMNIVFEAKDKSQETHLLEKFAAANTKGIKGHKAKGGFRVSNYIAQRIEAIEAVSGLII